MRFMREKICIDGNWLFHRGDFDKKTPALKGPVYISSKSESEKWGPAARFYDDKSDSYDDGRELSCDRWETVDLPHDYMIEKTPDRGCNNTRGYVEYENAWYRKYLKITKEDEGKRITLYFEGIATQSDIYVNGHIVKHNYCGYNPFEIDISDVLEYDVTAVNVVAVYTNAKAHNGWWYEGGGICRHVWLQKTAPVCVETHGLYILPEKCGENEWQVTATVTLLNETQTAQRADVSVRLLDGEKVIGKSCDTADIASYGKTDSKTEISVSAPRLWDINDPYMYTAEVTVCVNGDEYDRYTDRFGFRNFEFNCDKGFLLNGRRVTVNGVCCHEGFGITGRAVPDSIQRYQIRLMKEMGANGYRTSHYQQTKSYMDAFDEQGFLVMDEARWFESTKEAMEQLESLIKRDRNRPSVIMWSTSNEEPLHITDTGRKLHKAIAAQIRKYDYTRPVTAAEDKTPDKSAIYDECDFIGINYNLSIYDTVHKMRPNKPVFASECCATGTTRDWNFDADANGRIRDKDRDANDWFLGREKIYKALRERSYVFGCYQWAAVEHRGEAAWPRVCSCSGALDLFLQKKGAFYQNKSHWTKEPMAHIVPHWNFKGLEGKEILVTVYTNCEESELFLNGESLGKQQIEKYGHGEWNVKYTPGTLEVKGYIGGKEVCSDKRVTTGKPVALRLTRDNDFTANGSDIALFTCECVDENGRAVPDAAEYVSFSVSAPARIIGTGSDNCDHNNVANTSRKMYMGKIRVAVKLQKGQKSFTLTAMNDNCGICKIDIIL